MSNFVKLPVLFFFFFLFISVGFSQPDAPTNLRVAQVSWGKFIFVKLDWKNTSTHSAGYNFFNIYRKKGAISDSGKFRRIYHNIPFDSWRDKFIHRGETYSYYVTAVNMHRESEPSDTVQVTIDSNVTKAIISGIVKNRTTGAAIKNALVTFLPVFGWGMTTVKTDSGGNYYTKVYPGIYILYIRAAGYFSEYYDGVYKIFHAKKIAVKSGDSLSIPIGLSPRIASKIFKLSGSVKDTSGHPVKSWITIFNLTANARSHRFYHSITGSDGNYSVRIRQGDTVIVFARAFNRKYIPEFYNNKRNFLTADRIGIAQNVKNIDFVLEPKQAYNNGITGVVQNSDSIGVEAIVMAIRKNDLRARHSRYTTITDSSGNYSLKNFIPGEYILLTIPQGNYLPTYFKYDGSTTLHYRDADSVVVDSSGVVPGIVFNVNALQDSGAAVISGIVKDNSGNPVDGVIVFAADDNKSIYSFGVTGINGLYSIRGLVPGSYTTSTDLPGYSTAQSNTINLDYVSNYSSNDSFIITPEVITSVQENVPVITGYALNQNYPNPFNPTTTISYQIPTASHVVLKVFNILGKEVATLINANKQAGNYKVIFDANKLASGIYFYQIHAGNFIATRKLVLLK